MAHARGIPHIRWTDAEKQLIIGRANQLRQQKYYRSYCGLLHDAQLVLPEERRRNLVGFTRYTYAWWFEAIDMSKPPPDTPAALASHGPWGAFRSTKTKGEVFPPREAPDMSYPLKAAATAEPGSGSSDEAESAYAELEATGEPVVRRPTPAEAQQLAAMTTPLILDSATASDEVSQLFARIAKKMAQERVAQHEAIKVLTRRIEELLARVIELERSRAPVSLDTRKTVLVVGNMPDEVADELRTHPHLDGICHLNIRKAPHIARNEVANYHLITMTHWAPLDWAIARKRGIPPSRLVLSRADNAQELAAEILYKLRSLDR